MFQRTLLVCLTAASLAGLPACGDDSASDSAAGSNVSRNNTSGNNAEENNATENNADANNAAENNAAENNAANNTAPADNAEGNNAAPQNNAAGNNNTPQNNATGNNEQPVEEEPAGPGIMNGTWEVRRKDDDSLVVSLFLVHTNGQISIEGTYQLETGSTGTLIGARYDNTLIVQWSDAQFNEVTLFNGTFLPDSTDELAAVIGSNAIIGTVEVRVLRVADAN